MKSFMSNETSGTTEMDSKAEKAEYGASCRPAQHLKRNVDSTRRLYGSALAQYILQRASYIFEMFQSHSSPSCSCFFVISSIIMFALALLLLVNCASIVFTAPAHNGPSTYALESKAAVDALQEWYNTTSGLWDTTGWWNSANVVTMLADLVAIDASVERLTKTVFPNTFAQAQKYNLQQLKIRTPTYIETFDKDEIPNGHEKPPVINPKGFVNDYYDDEGWWALAWIRVYDHTHEPQYLIMAEDIFRDLLTGWNAICGGLWWNKPHNGNNAIENELFISVAAHLANRVNEDKKLYYLNWALESWSWFRNSGMINSQNTINDGLDLRTCQNNNGTIWSYNQGVILGALVELYSATSSAHPIIVTNTNNYLPTASLIAHAAIAHLTSADGILHDPCEPDCGNDGPQFKGVFMRNLQALQAVAPDQAFSDFIERNAQSVWERARSARGNLLGVVWSGPFLAGGGAASPQSSGAEALVAALSLREKGTG